MPRLTSSVQKLFSDNKKKIFSVWLLFEITNNIYAGTIYLPANTSNTMYGANAPVNDPYYGFSDATYHGQFGSIANGSIHVDNGSSNNIVISNNVANGTLFYTPHGDSGYYVTYSGGDVTITDGLDIYSNTSPGTLSIGGSSISNQNYSIYINSGVTIRSTGSYDVMNFIAGNANVSISNSGTIGSSANAGINAINLGVTSNNLNLYNYGNIYGGISCGANTTINMYGAGQLYGALYHPGSGTNNLNIQVNSDRTYNFAYEVNNFNITSNVNVSVSSGGWVHGTSNFNNPGLMSINGGSFSLPITNNAGQYVNVSGGTLSSNIANNYGYVQVISGTSNGDITNASGGNINVSGGNENGNVTNNTGGNITVTGGSVGGSINNSGILSMSAGTINSALTNNAGGTIAMTGGTISGSNALGNAGTFNFSNGNIALNAAINNTGTFSMSGGTVTGSGNINNSGTTNISAGTITTTSTIVNNSGGTITMTGGTITGSGTITNNGRLTANKGATISSTGTITNTGTLDLEGGTVTSPIDNQASGLLIVGNGSTISSSSSLTNSGTLQANPGGIISMAVTFDALNGGMINLNGGYITGAITGHGLSTDIINILADGNSSQSLSQVKNVGNIFVNTNNFTINTTMKGVNYNFITGNGSNVTIGGGGDVSGNGAISNAGILSISGGTIGADSAMGNVINSGTFDVAGDVKVRSFTNGINQPAGSSLLTSVETLKIVVNTNGKSDGTLGNAPAGAIPIIAPIESLDHNTTYAKLGSAVDIGSNSNISLLDPNYANQKNPKPDLVTIMANQGTLNFSAGTNKPATVTVKGLGSSILYLQGPPGDINSYISALQFTPTFSQYGIGTVTISINDNATGGVDVHVPDGDTSDKSLNSGTLNIRSNNMTTNHVTNTQGSINITGGDLSGCASNTYDITNLAFASNYDSSQNSNVNTNQITISGSATIGKSASFNNIINNGILTVKDATSTVKATTIQLKNTARYTTNTSGIMTTSGVINADITFSGSEILNIGGGAINNPITGLDTTKASTINVFGTFTTSNNINNINNINVTNDTKGVGNFTVNNTISGIGTQFTTAQGTIVTINNSGHILGGGIITNAGTMTISSPPKATGAADTDIAAANADIIGASALPMGNFTNTGAVNINANNIYVTGFTNNDAKAILNITGGLLKIGTNNFNNAAGTVNISNGNISSNQVNNSGVINITTTGVINAPIANGGTLNLYVADKNKVSHENNIGNITNKLNLVTGTINVNTGGELNNTNLSIAGGTINLNSGGTINIPISFDAQGGTLNLVGGTLNNDINSSLALSSGTGIVNVKADYTYSGVHTINNINQFNVSSGTTNINSAITNLNGSARVAQGATLIVNNQGNISGNATSITNSGTITLNTGGTLSLPVLFGINGGTLNLSGGYLTSKIGGATSSGRGTINLTSGTNYSDFDQNISNIDTINVQGTSFSINDPITSINNAFYVAQGSTVTINTNGYLSGNGTINNDGIITLSAGTIGIINDKIGKINNSGTINVNNNIYVSGNIINNNNSVTTSSSGGAGIFDTVPTSASSAAQAATGIIVNKGGNIYGDANSVLQNYGIVTLNKGGTVNIPINFGTTDVGVLNLSGGTMQGNIHIQGGDGISTSAGTINVNVDTTYTGSGYTIDHVNNINVNNTSTFKIQSNIVGVNNTFSTASGAAAIIQSGAQIDGSGVITNAGNLYVQNGSVGSVNRSFINLQNTGILKVDSTGSIYAALINDNGSMTTSGNIHASILFGSNITQLNIGGGTISGTITGYTADPNAVGNSNVINITGDFSTSNKINDVGSINVNKGTFTINNPIAELSNTFATAYNTITNLTSNGSINGAGIINNIGTINVGGSIGILGTNGAANTPFSNIYNDGMFNMNTGSTVIVNNIYNGILAPSNHDAASNEGLFNIYGNISINVSALNLNIDLNSQSITGSLPGTQTTPENTNLTFSAANKNAITLTGIDDNGGTVQLTAAHGSLSISSANAANLTSMSGNNSNTLVIAGSLNNLNNALQGLVFIPDANYVGADANIEIYLQNNQVASASDSSASTTVTQPPVGYIPTFTVNNGTLQTKVLDNVSTVIINGGTDNLGAITNHSANAVLNITGGLVTATSVTNTLGAINISGGDLSSASAANPSPLNNAAGQTITISGTGTLGLNQAFGDISNNGILQATGTNLATGNNITIGNFTNNALGAQLDISGGKVATGNISNTLGTINISGGDLSSASLSNPSTVNNAAGQIITVSGTGTIGFNRAFGNVTNNGILKSTGTNLASGNNITIGNFTNNALGAQLDISGGKVATGNISNKLGTINISGGDLSSVSSVNPSTLNNAAGQVVTLSGTGTIGANKALGIFNNNGLFNVIGSNISVSTLSNSGVVNMLRSATISNGNYTVTNTGTHIVDIDVSNIPATLNLANGTVTLQNNATIDIKYNGDVLVPNNHVYNVITSSHPPITPGLDANNNINGINILGSTDLVYYTPHQSGNNIQVISHRRLIEDIVDNVGNYPATPAATVLDGLINSGAITGDLRTALARLDGLGTDQEVSDAVNQLLPETSITSDMGFIAPSMTFSTIAERAELIARSGIDNTQTGYAYGGSPINNGFWVKGFGGSIQQKQKVTTAGYNANTAGIAFGLDNQLFENTWVGLGFSTVNTHINSKDVSAKKTTVVTQQATLYASYSPEHYYIDSLVAMAFNSYKLQRHIVYNNLNYRSQAAYNAIQPAAKISTGYIYDVNPVFKIIPNLSLQYSLLRQSTYTEYGAGNLSLRDVTSPILTQLEGGAGVKFSFLQEQDEQIYKPELHFMVLHDFKSSAQTTTAQFIGGGGTFAITSALPNKTSYNAGLGFTVVQQDQFNFTLRYDFKYRNKFIGHSGYLAVRYMF